MQHCLHVERLGQLPCQIMSTRSDPSTTMDPDPSTRPSAQDGWTGRTGKTRSEPSGRLSLHPSIKVFCLEGRNTKTEPFSCQLYQSNTIKKQVFISSLVAKHDDTIDHFRMAPYLKFLMLVAVSYAHYGQAQLCDYDQDRANRSWQSSCSLRDYCDGIQDKYGSQVISCSGNLYSTHYVTEFFKDMFYEDYPTAGFDWTHYHTYDGYKYVTNSFRYDLTSGSRLFLYLDELF
ncbi:hypothetical protein FisN_1Lu724, partial [Fistulifera solaris]